MANLGVASVASRSKFGSSFVVAAVSATALLSGCADMPGAEFAQLLPTSDTGPTTPAAPGSLASLKAHYEAAPNSAERAVAYASGLKEAGNKQEAYSVLRATVLATNGVDRTLLSEYGRTALELGDIGIAKEALAKADDPQNPDWRVVMARGTALAKESHYQLALPFFERAYQLEPAHPSVLSNLALAYTMTGQAEKGEPLLRQAIAGGSADPRLKKNLALILKVQGKSDDVAVAAASKAVPAAEAAANAITTSSISRIDTGDGAPLPPIPVDANRDNADYSTDMAE